MLHQSVAGFADSFPNIINHYASAYILALGSSCEGVGCEISHAPLLFGIACLIVFAATYLIVKWQYGETLSLLQTRNETLTASLKERPSPGSGTLDQDYWLNEIADKDRLELQNGVFVTECIVQESLTEEGPHVTFNFSIRNCAVYAITVDPILRGFISLIAKRLWGEVTLSSSLPHNLKHCWGDRFQIRQELAASDVAKIKELDEVTMLSRRLQFPRPSNNDKRQLPHREAVPSRLQFHSVSRRNTSGNEFQIV